MRKSFFVKEGLRQWYLPLTVTLARHNNLFFGAIPLRPAAGNVMVTHNCNSRCLMCSFWKRRSLGELTLPEVEDILSQMKEMGIRRICFSGGEPLLRSDLDLILRKARDLRFENTQIITNGLLWNDRKARALLENGLNRVSVSIDGTGEAHDQQRGVKGAFQRTLKTLKLLVNLRDEEYPGLEVEVGMTLTRITMSHMRALLEICATHRVSCTLQILEHTSFWSKPLATEISDIQIEGKQIIDSMADELHQLKESYPISIIVGHLGLEFMRHYLKGEESRSMIPDVPCTAGFTSVYVNAHGEVYPGCWAVPPVGHLRKKQLKEIICGEDYKVILRQMFLKKCPRCPNGYIWSEWYYLPALLREILWRLNRH